MDRPHSGTRPSKRHQPVRSDGQAAAARQGGTILVGWEGCQAEGPWGGGHGGRQTLGSTTPWSCASLWPPTKARARRPRSLVGRNWSRTIQHTSACRRSVIVPPREEPQKNCGGAAGAAAVGYPPGAAAGGGTAGGNLLLVDVGEEVEPVLWVRADPGTIRQQVDDPPPPAGTTPTCDPCLLCTTHSAGHATLPAVAMVVRQPRLTRSGCVEHPQLRGCRRAGTVGRAVMAGRAGRVPMAGRARARMPPHRWGRPPPHLLEVLQRFSAWERPGVIAGSLSKRFQVGCQFLPALAGGVGLAQDLLKPGPWDLCRAAGQGSHSRAGQGTAGTP